MLSVLSDSRAVYGGRLALEGIAETCNEISLGVLLRPPTGQTQPPVTKQAVSAVDSRWPVEAEL